LDAPHLQPDAGPLDSQNDPAIGSILLLGGAVLKFLEEIFVRLELHYHRQAQEDMEGLVAV
jgi:hypothetical protein